jgi:hypothetical protein
LGIELKIKEVEFFDIEIMNALNSADKIINELGKRELKDKIVLLKLHGKLNQGKTSDINFPAVDNFVKSKEAYCLLKSTSKLIIEEPEIKIEIEDMDKLEEEIIKKYNPEQKSKYRHDKSSNH